MNPVFKIVDFNKKIPNVQKLGSVINNRCEPGKFPSDAKYLCGRFCVTVGELKQNGWNRVSDWKWMLDIQSGLGDFKSYKEGEFINGFRVSPGKFEVFNEVESNINNESDFPNDSGMPNLCIGARWERENLEERIMIITAAAEFEDEDGNIEDFEEYITFGFDSYKEYWSNTEKPIEKEPIEKEPEEEKPEEVKPEEVKPEEEKPEEVKPEEVKPVEENSIKHYFKGLVTEINKLINRKKYIIIAFIVLISFLLIKFC